MHSTTSPFVGKIDETWIEIHVDKFSGSDSEYAVNNFMSLMFRNVERSSHEVSVLENDCRWGCLMQTKDD